ncbi:hypothetical protein CEK28_14410 [Xenophilus sp. AP218F]|nr:hypothetical protein [Chromobacterium sp. ASV5]OWY38111.1 hypothetical protein CEK28_14410 [Xenophilus sp. AP218F]
MVMQGKRVAVIRAWLGLGLLGFSSLALADAGADACSRSQAPQRCEAFRQGKLSCGDLPERDRRACLDVYTPALSCLRARDAKRCEALQAAQASCEGLEGAPRRQCLDERLPQADCGRVKDAGRCQRGEAATPCPTDGGRGGRACRRDGLISD